jgi:hypothetical protein
MSGPLHPASLAEGCCGAFVRRARLGAMVSAKKLCGRLSSDTPEKWDSPSLLPTIYDARVPGYAVLPEVSWSKSNSCSVTFRFKPQRDTSDANNEFERR